MVGFRIFSAAALMTAAVAASPAIAGEREFFNSVQGQWSGPGQIVAGKYKGTRFTCDLKGVSNTSSVGVELDGQCRVGMFSQSMKASVTRGGKGFRGKFLDGAAGKGLDITSGSVEGNRVVFTLNREQLRGTMSARVSANKDMNVTISVKVDDQLVPVIAMTLKRMDEKSTASID